MKNTLLLLVFFPLFHIKCIAQFSTMKELSIITPHTSCLFMMDIDNDGLKDAIITSDVYLNHQLSWFKNVDGLNFGEQIFINAGTDVAYAVKADLNGDSFEDLIVSSNYYIRWIANNGDGTFGAPQFIENSSNDQILLDDIDGDLILDLIITYNGYISWKQGLGMGAFGPLQTIGPTYDQFHFADYDGDNDLDLLFVGNTGLYLKEFSGGIYGAFTTLDASITNGLAISSMDIDDDFDLDILIGNATGVMWLENIGGTFNPASILCTPLSESGTIEGALQIIPVDINGDMNKDLLVKHKTSSFSRTLGWFPKIGAGLFGAEQYISSDSTGVTSNDYLIIDTSDVDTDGYIDIIFTSFRDNYQFANNKRKIAWIRNIAGNMEIERPIDSQLSGIKKPISADFDNDGDQDIVFISRDLIGLYERISPTEYSGMKILNHAYDRLPSAFRLADMDNDGDQDVVMTDYKGNNFYSDQLAWYENLGNGKLGERQVIKDAINGDLGVVCKDFNGDGLKDIVYGGMNEIGYFRNLGGGNFAVEVPIYFGSLFGTNGKLEIGDIDGDGDLDIISSYYPRNIAWIENFGNNTFSSPKLIVDYLQVPELGAHMEIIDFDNDGDLDVLANGNVFDNIFWCENDGLGVFSAPNFIPITGDIKATGDLDNDGDDDLIVSSNVATFWYQNLGNMNYASGQSIPAFLQFITIDDIDEDGDNDIIGSYQFPGNLFFVSNSYFSTSQVRGTVYFDQNQNGQFDSLEFGLPSITVNTTPQSDYTFSYANGEYFVNLSDIPGVYDINVANYDNWTQTSLPSVYSINLTPSFTSMDSVNFGLYPSVISDSLNSNIIGGFPRCNQVVNYWLSIENRGTTMPSGIIKLTLDDSLTFISTTHTPDSIITQSIYWSMDSLGFFTTQNINIHVQMPDFHSINDTMTSVLEVTALDQAGGIVYTSNDELSQVVVCAYDPNDKQPEPAGIGTEGFIDPTEPYLDYLVRFQNTGNDTAITVRIKDQLSAHLDWTSIQVLAASDHFTTHIDQCGEVTFQFKDINLPDSTTDFLGSQGFIQFRVNIFPNLTHGTKIENTANIYFDFNPAVKTNTTLNTIFLSEATLNSNAMNSAHLYPNPFTDKIIIEGIPSTYKFSFYNISGQMIYTGVIGDGVIQTDKLASGSYILILEGNEEQIQKRLVKM